MQDENDKIDDVIINGTPDERKFVLENDLLRFAFYYFPEFFFFDTPDFHFDLIADLEDMNSGEINEAMWCIFRESAKTSLAKIDVIHKICYRKKRFINWDSYDKGNSEAALFDIANYLQTNQRLIDDFGQLYRVEDKDAKKQTEMKRVNEFVTTFGIKVKAYSTQKSTRGRVYKHWRPDYYILDDFEVTKTAESPALTAGVIEHIKELRAGMGAGVHVLYLCNYITESGSVQYIMDRAKESKKMRVRKIAVKENGKITWPSKFVETKEEAELLNRNEPDQKRWKTSLEQKRLDLGEAEFEKEYMNNPGATMDVVFDRRRIEALIENAREHLVVKENAGLSQWELYNAKHRYALGADTSEGVGRDSCATGIINFTRKPALVAATYANNRIAPDIFAHEIKRHATEYAECLVAPEVNNTGFATMTELRRIYPVEKIYKRVRTDLVNKQITKELGWKTTSATKAEIIYQFKSAVENGDLEIWDIDLLNECKFFNQNDLKAVEYKDGMTRHSDKLMAAAIAWEMRHHALVAEEQIVNKNKNYKQKEWETTSLYEGTTVEKDKRGGLWDDD